MPYVHARGGAKANDTFLKKHANGSARLVKRILAVSGDVASLDHFLTDWEAKNRLAAKHIGKVHGSARASLQKTRNFFANHFSPKKNRAVAVDVDLRHEENENRVIASQYLISAWRKVSDEFKGVIGKARMAAFNSPRRRKQLKTSVVQAFQHLDQRTKKFRSPENVKKYFTKWHTGAKASLR